MRHPIVRFSIILGALVIASAVSLLATVVVPAEFREVVAGSTLIVRGRVTDVRAVSTAGGGIDTIGTISVDRVIKGSATGFVSIRVPGGQLGRDRWVTVGAPTFAVGEQAVFFLSRGADNAWRPFGLMMGVYRLRLDARTRAVVIDAPVVAGQTASVGPVVRGDVRRRPLPVQEFESLVRLVMSSASAGGGR